MSFTGIDLRDEISRDIDPNYVQAPLNNTITPVTTLDGKIVLDFGAGGGASAINLCRLGASKVHGVDIDADLIGMAEMRVEEYGLDDRISFHPAKDTTRLPFEADTFDVVVCSAVLEHIRPADRQAHLAELWRVLQPGGYLFIMGTPNRLWPIDGHTTCLPLVPYLPLNVLGKYTLHKCPPFFRSGNPQMTGFHPRKCLLPG
ncbi:MAG: class I SAM-dependent methyltransferase [Chloroflexi bacterium]|nr:class I SAM-dependent methyltransferase [Chloroflexota bacterium]